MDEVWGFLALFGHFLGFSGHLDILKVLVSYEVTRVIILVVGTVHDGFWVGLGGSRGVWGVQRGSTLSLWGTFCPSGSVYGTRFGSKHYIIVKLAYVYWVGITDPFLAHCGPFRGSQMSKTNPYRAPNCPKISLLAPKKVIRWPKVTSFGTK